MTEQDKINCSFCKKSQTDVPQIIVGPSDIFICNECVDLCVSICAQARGDAARHKAEIEKLSSVLGFQP